MKKSKETSVLVGGPRTGKTASLVLKAAKEGAYIICESDKVAKMMKNYAYAIGLPIHDPIVIDYESVDSDEIQYIIGEATNHDDHGKILVDNLDLLISNIFRGSLIGSSISADFIGNVQYLGITPYESHGQTQDLIALKKAYDQYVFDNESKED